MDTLHYIKNLIKISLCSVIFYAGIFDLYIRWLPVLIINYHRFTERPQGVIDIEPAFTHLIKDFKKELDFIQRYFRILPLDEVVEKLKNGEEFNQPTVSITIDDGYKDSHDLILPILKENNIPVTIFLSTDFIGTNDRIWIDRLGETILNTRQKSVSLNGLFNIRHLALTSLRKKRQSYRVIVDKMKELQINVREKTLSHIKEQLGKVPIMVPIMLNWEEVKLMSKSRISFGAHTCTHPILTKMPLEDAKREIADSKKMIEERLGLGIEVKHFAYPNGRLQDFNEELRAYCKQIGFESISGYENNGGNLHTDDVFTLKRLAAYRPLSVFAFNLIRNL